MVLERGTFRLEITALALGFMAELVCQLCVKSGAGSYSICCWNGSH